mgnify:CR=1 FL=1
MKVGDLVKVNTRCDVGGLWHKVGIVLGRDRLGTTGDEIVRVLLGGRERLLDQRALDVVYASR